MKTHSPPDPRCGRRAPRRSVASEPPRQLEVEGVEVDVADALEELGGPGVGQGLGQSVAPGLVLGLQLAELRPRRALRPLPWSRSRPVSASRCRWTMGARHDGAARARSRSRP